MMTKQYTDELTNWVKKRKKNPPQNKTLVAFIAVKKDIIEAMEAGYSKNIIWEHLRETGKISCNYITFLKHVKTHITLQSSAKKPDEIPAPKKAVQTGPRKLVTQRKGFEVNPIPIKEDLI